MLDRPRYLGYRVQAAHGVLGMKEEPSMKATGRLIGLVLVLLAPVLLLYVTPGTALEWVNVTDERLLNADRDPSNWLTGLDHGVGHFRPLSITRQRHLLAYHG